MAVSPATPGAPPPRLCAWARRLSTGRRRTRRLEAPDRVPQPPVLSRRLHALLSVLVLQADALAKVQADRLGELRACTRKVA